MERNRWETALRCLEIAVHPNTSDEEVLAAIRGFRRTAGRTPLANITGGGVPSHLLARLDQLNRANLALRRSIEEIEADRLAALRERQESEQRAREIGEELLAAEHRVAIAQQRLAEFQGAYGRISGGLRDENDDLRRALDEARRNMAQPIHEPIRHDPGRPFQNALNAALQRSNTPSAPAFGRPWTA